MQHRWPLLSDLGDDIGGQVGGGKHVTRRARLDTSVRPAAPRVTTVRTGVVRDGVVRVPLPRALYPEHRRQHAGISALPLGLAPALVGFLRDFPHGCTEQIVSQGWPALVMLSRSARAGAAGKTLDFAATHRARDPSESVRLLLARLARRQNSAGGFGLWASSPRTERFATVYALHFLVEAKRHDVTLPPGLLDRGLRWARRELRRASDATIAEERLRAYAAYVLARAGRVVGGEVAAIHQRLEKHHRGYAHDLAAVYLAATYKLLRQHTLAKELIEKAVDFGRTRVPDYQAYYDALIHDAQLLHLLAEHFPRRAAKVSAAAIRAPAMFAATGPISSAAGSPMMWMRGCQRRRASTRA